MASEIGNPGKVCTRIEVGNTKKEAQILRLLGYRYASIQKERNRLRKIVQDFEEQAVEMLRKGEVVFEQKERSGAAKLLSQEEQKMRRIRSCLEWRTQKNHEAGNVEIRALRTIFAGSTVVVNGITKYIQETEHEASIRSNDSGLILYHR
ncbi:MAG: hypothetical protein PWP24_156 [Clostridiales bacterium]|nr:hypothetical protein [Clostridiales bacterium]